MPNDSVADAWLQRALLLRVAAAKWGEEGFYRVSAAVDPEIADAVRSFDRASAILVRR